MMTADQMPFGFIFEREEDGKLTVSVPSSSEDWQRLSLGTPAEALLSVVEMDYTEYYAEVKKLADHPLFAPKIDISEEEYADFFGEAICMPALLKDRDPISFAALGLGLAALLYQPDDGTASGLLRQGGSAMHLLSIPYLMQLQLRNIFEVVFDDTERLSQQERLERLRQVYPEVADTIDRLGNQFDGHACRIVEPQVIYFLILYLYFQQDRQRIARCQCCWKYFIPKTKKETLYCDRISDGKSCKQRGPNLMRKVGPEVDEALGKYNTLRNRMMARLIRYEDAAPWERNRLIQMDYGTYQHWLEMANAARSGYLHGRLSAEMFLRRIDVNHEFTDYHAEVRPLPDVHDTIWRQNVEKNFNFDPDRYFEDGLMTIDLGEENSRWNVYTHEEMIKQAKNGFEGLQEKYKE